MEEPDPEGVAFAICPHALRLHHVPALALRGGDLVSWYPIQSETQEGREDNSPKANLWTFGFGVPGARCYVVEVFFTRQTNIGVSVLNALSGLVTEKPLIVV